MAAIGVEDLAEIAARCSQLRVALGLPATLWTEGRLAEVLADALLDAGWPAGSAVAALLAIAADPTTRSPARLSCPGPWWDQPKAPYRAASGEEDRLADHADLAELEAVLAELDGRRVLVQQQARAQLAAEGLPLTRRSVARRAVDLVRGEATRVAQLSGDVGAGA